MFITKTASICIYFFIILLVPLFLDVLLKKTVREKRFNDIFNIAKNNAIKKKKSLIVFNGTNDGAVYQFDKTANCTKSDFKGNFNQIINQLEFDSCVILICYTLEYIEDFQSTIKTLLQVSGNDLYTINFENKSFRVWWDYKMINILNTSYLMPKDFVNKLNNQIKFTSPSQLQINTQELYKILFKIVPYNLFVN